MDPDSWSEESIFWTIVLILLVALVGLVSMDVGVGESKVVSGLVTSIGVDTATVYELPEPVITVSLKNGRTAQLKVDRNSLLKKGDKVVLSESKKLISPGFEYKLIEAQE